MFSCYFELLVDVSKDDNLRFFVQNQLTTYAEGSSSIMSGIKMGSFRILGVSSSPTSVRVNGNSVSFGYINSVIDFLNFLMFEKSIKLNIFKNFHKPTRCRPNIIAM